MKQQFLSHLSFLIKSAKILQKTIFNQMQNSIIYVIIQKYFYFSMKYDSINNHYIFSYIYNGIALVSIER